MAFVYENHAVWSYKEQGFVYFIPCPGEKRVRLDVFDDLKNYDVYEVSHEEGDTIFLKEPVQPLKDWRIDYS